MSAIVGVSRGALEKGKFRKKALNEETDKSFLCIFSELPLEFEYYETLFGHRPYRLT